MRSASAEGAAGGARKAIGDVKMQSGGRRELVTSQPDVVCGVCGRHLLRGEQPDEFLADGEPQLVCDLCTVRARQQGWVRAEEVSLEPREVEAGPRSRHGPLNLMRRWRSGGGRSGAAEVQADRRSGARSPRAQPVVGRLMRTPDGEDQQALGGGGPAPASSAHGDRNASGGEDPGAREEHAALATAIDAFNNTEQPRRIGGVAKSLGAPCVTVRAAGPSASAGPPVENRGSPSAQPERVAIVAAWELCWYRWEVDLDGTWPSPDLVASGTDLEELPADDLAGNAVVDERGIVSLAGASLRSA